VRHSGAAAVRSRDALRRALVLVDESLERLVQRVDKLLVAAEGILDDPVELLAQLQQPLHAV
jgi:hypothetical protein